MADLSSEPRSIQSIYTWYRENKLFVNRRYQRKLVWTLEEKQKLIESILKKYPIPAILIAEREEETGSFEIIDGLQRIHAIVSFIETSFPTLENKYFDVDLFPTAKGYSDAGLFEITEHDSKLSQREIGAFLDYSLAFSVMRNAKVEEINDVFDRINTYGHRLSDQERRQAGIQNDFCDLVREAAVFIRGDVSDDILPLLDMPSISVDLPLTKHGYQVKAEEVFWVEQGILRSTDLRDSMDEQCISDIASCIIGGSLISRSKSALDNIFDSGHKEYDRIISALDAYGKEKFLQEFKYIIGEIEKVCKTDGDEKLRDIIFKTNTTNPFQSVFAVLFIAFHEIIFSNEKTISDYNALKLDLKNIAERLDTGRGAGVPAERRKNIDSIKGIIEGCFIKSEIKEAVYDNPTNIDVESYIRRSEVELPNYELKQGLVTLGVKRELDKNLLDKITKTICAISNNGNGKQGRILIGVTDDEKDASRVEDLDSVEPKKIGRKSIVGINREISVLGITSEEYFSILTNFIKDSSLTEPLKSQILSDIDLIEYYGFGLIIITIIPHSQLSYYKDRVFYRSGNSTLEAETPKLIAEIAQRFN
jgi:hypothetical protein